MGPIQAVLDSASNLPPPLASIPEGGANVNSTNISSFTTNSVSGAPPQLIAVSGHTLDLAILCDNNTIRAVNLLDVDKNRSGGNLTGLSEITFAAGISRLVRGGRDFRTLIRPVR